MECVWELCTPLHVRLSIYFKVTDRTSSKGEHESNDGDNHRNVAHRHPATLKHLGNVAVGVSILQKKISIRHRC